MLYFVFLDIHNDIDVFPVISDKVNTKKDSNEDQVNLLEKLCVESSLPGLFRCYR